MREEWGSKNPKTERGDSVSGVPCETAVWGNNGRWWVPVDGMEVLGGLRICQHEARAGIYAKNPKPSICSSILGVLCKMVVWGDDGRW